MGHTKPHYLDWVRHVNPKNIPQNHKYDRIKHQNTTKNTYNYIYNHRSTFKNTKNNTNPRIKTQLDKNFGKRITFVKQLGGRQNKKQLRRSKINHNQRRFNKRQNWGKAKQENGESNNLHAEIMIASRNGDRSEGEKASTWKLSNSYGDPSSQGNRCFR